MHRNQGKGSRHTFESVGAILDIVGYSFLNTCISFQLAPLSFPPSSLHTRATQRSCLSRCTISFLHHYTSIALDTCLRSGYLHLSARTSSPKSFSPLFPLFIHLSSLSSLSDIPHRLYGPSSFVCSPSIAAPFSQSSS